MIIDPLKNLTQLKVLGLFHNEIFNEESALEILQSLPKLEELSIDGNPISTKMVFHYSLVLTLPKLQILDEDAIKELDRDIATQYFQDNKCKFFLIFLVLMPGTKGLLK